MITIDTPPGGFNEEPIEVGATHMSLNGTSTKDVFGYKRRWSIPLAGLAPTALSWFELCYRNSTGPAYFLDEQRINRLSVAASSTLSAWAQTDAFSASQGPGVVSTTTAGVPARLSCTTGTEVLQTLAPLSALHWTPTVAGTIRAGDALVPVGLGEKVCFSIYLLSGACTIELVPFGPTLVAGAPLIGGVTLAENKPRRYLTVTIPSDGSVVAVKPQLRVLAAGAVDTIGWQVEAAELPSPWVLGSPAAHVLVALGTLGRRHYGNNIDSALSLSEV
jgi:hypothetical protein